jgi:hypothetical protein
VITVDDVLTSDGKFPERASLADSNVKHRIEVLLPLVIEFLSHYGTRPEISSGYRDPASNAKAGGSAKSAHCEGRAIDFKDPKGHLAAFARANKALLAALKLYCEDPAYTPGWLHITDRPPRSRSIFFKP